MLSNTSCTCHRLRTGTQFTGFNTGTPQSRGNGSFTGSTLGDFLLWSTIFGSHDHGGWGGHRHDDRDSSWGGGFGGFGGFGGGSSGGDDSPEMGWGGSSF